MPRSRSTPAEDFSQASLKPFGDKAHAFAFRNPAEDKRINILEGAVRSSKTWAMLPKLIQLCRYKVPGRRLITGASKAAVYNNILNDVFDVIGTRNYSYNTSSGALRLFDTSWRVIGAADQGAERYIRGATVGINYSDELSLMPNNFFKMLLSRMSPAGARFYATTNPDSPYHWLKTDVLDNEALQKDLFVEHFTLDDNPNLDPEFREFIKRSYTGIFYQRFILGRWVLAEGAIYRDVLTDDVFYDDSTRPLGLETRGGHREHWIACDWGTANPCVFLDIFDDGNTVWIDREYYWDSQATNYQKTNSQYADDLMTFIGPTVDQRFWPGIILDPSALSFKAELRNRGLMVREANNEVLEGISKVSTMLHRKRLRIHRRCTMTQREMATYSWDEKKAKGGIEQPIKFHDHAADAVRYHIHTQINQYRLAA